MKIDLLRNVSRRKTSKRRSLPVSALVAGTAIAMAAGCGGASDTGAGAQQDQDTQSQETTAFYGNVVRVEQVPAEVDRLSRDHLWRAAGSGVSVGERELRATRTHTDGQGITHTRFQQAVGNIPVFGGEAYVHVLQDGSLQAVTDDMLRDIRVRSTTPTVPREDAVQLALAEHGCSDCLNERPRADLWVLRHAGQDRLVYRVQMRQLDGTAKTSMPVIFIDANTGEKVWSYNNLQTVAGSGSSLYSGTVTIETTLYNSAYYMEENTTVNATANAIRRIGTFDMRNTTGSVYRFSDADNVWNTTSQRAGVDAHYGARAAWDYFYNIHGRRGIDGNNGPGRYAWVAGSTIGLISSRVHYGTNYNNAYWDGTQMTYGDGDGSTFTPLVTLDIAGHEITHGVTERTAGLVYSSESGALNESMSDVFGSMIERYRRGVSPNTQTWQIGEQCYTPATAGDALRYMNNPHLAQNYGYTADDDPDHYAERYTGTADNGGVHINSGIPNYVFYLVSQGGTHHRSGVTVTGIGYAAAERIWYRALTSYLTSSSNFASARAATLNAAAALYGSGSAQYNTVAQAWTACGI